MFSHAHYNNCTCVVQELFKGVALVHSAVISRHILACSVPYSVMYTGVMHVRFGKKLFLRTDAISVLLVCTVVVAL